MCTRREHVYMLRSQSLLAFLRWSWCGSTRSASTRSASTKEWPVWTHTNRCVRWLHLRTCARKRHHVNTVRAAARALASMPRRNDSMYRLDASMQRLDASTSPVGVTTLRRIKLDANGSLDGSTQPRRLDARLNSSMPGLSFHPGTYLQWQHTQ